VAYIACTNAATDPADAFVLDPRDYAAAADEGTVLAIVHSHPNASAHPSMADRVMCERSGLPWLIMGWPSGVMTRTEPVGWRAPLVGREFHHGVLDCYTLIQDYYAPAAGPAAAGLSARRRLVGTGRQPVPRQLCRRRLPPGGRAAA
jgi:proteasome lid subunit RPN8/RPN11